ncbi:MAG TPA: hypothetical protein VGL06_23155 [Pseudonocardiaceae bacterium]|jgi:hypothetical protein
MIGTGVRDPEDPDRWLVAPWPADATFGAVLHHFRQASVARLPSDGGIARLLAFHEGFRAALAAAPIEEFTDQDQHDWCGHILDCAELSVTLFQNQYLAHHGHDPQADEDEHVQTIQHRSAAQLPGP